MNKKQTAFKNTFGLRGGGWCKTRAAGLEPGGRLPPFFNFLSISIFILALFISCKTTPPLPDPLQEETGTIPLGPGALVYLFADAQKARPVLELLPIPELKAKQSKDILDRTRSAVAALYGPESGKRFQLTTWGGYPDFGAGLALGADKNWKKLRSAGGQPYWYSAANRLSISLNSQQAFVTASLGETPVEPFAGGSGVEVPEGFGEFRRGGILSCWLDKPGPLLDRVLRAAGIPLQIPAERIFVNLLPAAGQEGQYEALLRLQTPSAAQARGLVTVFALARLFAAGGNAAGGEGFAVLAALLFANPPVQDGQNLDIKTGVLTEKEIALLFQLFSVKSDEEGK